LFLASGSAFSINCGYVVLEKLMDGRMEGGYWLVLSVLLLLPLICLAFSSRLFLKISCGIFLVMWRALFFHLPTFNLYTQCSQAKREYLRILFSVFSLAGGKVGSVFVAFF